MLSNQLTMTADMPNCKWKRLGRIVESGLVAVIRAESSEQATRIAGACADGGVTAIEVTFTVPGAAAVIEDLVRRFKAGGARSVRVRCSTRKRRAWPYRRARSLWWAPA